MKNKRKCGFTLLELLITITVSTIIGVTLLNLSIGVMKEYILSSEQVVLLDKLDNAMLNLDVLFNSNGITNISCNMNIEGCSGDNLFATYYEDINNNVRKDKIVYLNDSRLMIRTIKYEDGIVSKSNNILLYDVEKFSVSKKGKLIYYSIIMKNGENRIRCI